MRYFKIFLLPYLFLVVFIFTCNNEKYDIPEVGDTIPAFQANDQNGNLWRSTDHLETGYLVVYFYPAAMTGGCTKQACGFRDNKLTLDDFEVEVVGISGDPVKNLKIFEKSNNLNFTLLSDVSGKISKIFGVPVKQGGSVVKELDDNEITLIRALTPARWTFILDKNSKIVFKNTDVNAENDSNSVVDFLNKL